MAQIYLDAWIDELEALVGGGVPAPPPDAPAQEAERAAPKKPKPEKKAKPPPAPEPASDAAAPVCTQLEFKVGTDPKTGKLKAKEVTGPDGSYVQGQPKEMGYDQY